MKKKTLVQQKKDNLEFCSETLGLNKKQTKQVLAATNELGVNVEYFANEFMETSSVQVHQNDYLNIAMFNAMFWEF
tara:strand:+ start:421 stop:648 length:228 start_codon:yes stop_codon:yes gene_type:complete